MSFPWKMRLTLLILVIMAFTNRFWAPLIPDYQRGLLFGAISGYLLGSILERQRQRRKRHAY